MDCNKGSPVDLKTQSPNPPARRCSILSITERVALENRRRKMTMRRNACVSPGFSFAASASDIGLSRTSLTTQ